jgi:hypothetical protein
MTSLTLTIAGPVAKELKAAASTHGVSVERFLQLLLVKHQEEQAWATALAGDDIAADEAAVAEFDRTGVGIPGDEVLGWLDSLQTDQPLPPPSARKLK